MAPASAPPVRGDDGFFLLRIQRSASRHVLHDGGVSRNIDIAPGTLIEDARGRVIGAVQDIRTNAKGAVQAIPVRVGDARERVPVSNFSVAGDGGALVSAMGRGQLQKTSQAQSAGTPNCRCRHCGRAHIFRAFPAFPP